MKYVIACKCKIFCPRRRHGTQRSMFALIAISKIVFHYFSAQKKASKKFTVRLCDDVLIGILSFGSRRYFALLEQHGTRFQYFIDRYWPEAPLLILDMDCWTYEKKDDKVLLPVQSGC